MLLAARGVAAPAAAQTRLTLPEAIARARSQARAGYFPKVHVTESWQRGNLPVIC